MTAWQAVLVRCGRIRTPSHQDAAFSLKKKRKTQQQPLRCCALNPIFILGKRHKESFQRANHTFPIVFSNHLFFLCAFGQMSRDVVLRPRRVVSSTWTQQGVQQWRCIALKPSRFSWTARDDAAHSFKKKGKISRRLASPAAFLGRNSRGQRSPRPELTWASPAGCVQIRDALPHLSGSATLSGYRRGRFVVLAASSTCEQANLLAFKFQQPWVKTPPHEAWTTSTSPPWGWVEPHDSAGRFRQTLSDKGGSLGHDRGYETPTQLSCPWPATSKISFLFKEDLFHLQ